MASHQRNHPGRTARCQSRYVSNIASGFLLLLIDLLSLIALFLFRYSAIGLKSRKVFMLNKNIVHLIDDISWNMGFKTETQADKVMHIISIIRIISIMRIICIISIMRIISIISIKRIIAGSSRAWTSGPRVAGKEDVDCPIS